MTAFNSTSEVRVPSFADIENLATKIGMQNSGCFDFYLKQGLTTGDSLKAHLNWLHQCAIKDQGIMVFDTPDGLGYFTEGEGSDSCFNIYNPSTKTWFDWSDDIIAFEFPLTMFIPPQACDNPPLAVTPISNVFSVTLADALGIGYSDSLLKIGNRYLHLDYESGDLMVFDVSDGKVCVNVEQLKKQKGDAKVLTETALVQEGIPRTEIELLKVLVKKLQTDNKKLRGICEFIGMQDTYIDYDLTAKVMKETE